MTTTKREISNDVQRKTGCNKRLSVKKSLEFDYPPPKAVAFRRIHGYATVISLQLKSLIFKATKAQTTSLSKSLQGHVFVSRATHMMVVEGATGKVIYDIMNTPGPYPLRYWPSFKLQTTRISFH
jgi:hypothetical protein